jgi:hypothetical protein
MASCSIAILSIILVPFRGDCGIIRNERARREPTVALSGVELQVTDLLQARLPMM